MVLILRTLQGYLHPLRLRVRTRPAAGRKYEKSEFLKQEGTVKFNECQSTSVVVDFVDTILLRRLPTVVTFPALMTGTRPEAILWSIL